MTVYTVPGFLCQTIPLEVPVTSQSCRRILCLLCLAAGLTVNLGGCGQKGDLYLPHDKPKGMFQP